MDIYVGNLAYATTDEGLRAAFAAYGEVTSARVVTDRMNGRSKGFGFVEMPDRAQAQAAIDAFNATKECMYLRKTPKKTREIEIRQYICGELQAEAAENDMLRLKMAIRITPGGSVKPQEILNVLCEKFALPVRAETALVHRGALLCEGKDLLSAGEVRQ